MNKRTRLCIVNPFQHGGGAEFQIDRLIDKLVELNRYEIYYLARHLEPGLEAGRYSAVKIGRSDVPPRFGYLMDAAPLYRALREISPNVIYQRVACGYTGVCGYYASRHPVRFIWHVAHDSDLTGESISSGRNFIRHYMDRRSIEYGLRRAHSIIVQKNDQRELLRRNYNREAAAVVANFHPEPQEVIDKSGPITVVWAANLKPWKQPEIFVRLAGLCRDIPGVEFVMVGAPDTGSRGRAWSEEIMRDIAALPNLRYLGGKTQKEVNELLARAHVFVNTSLYEGFPNTFIQAWMREVPVVSLHVDPDGILNREKIGIFAGSEENLIGSVRLLLENPKLREEYGINARKHAYKAHSLLNAEKLAELVAG